MRMFLAICLLMFMSSCCIKCIHPTNNPTSYIKDNYDRIVIYHGANLSNYAKHVNKGRAGITWQDSVDFMKMKSEGYNVVRYLVFWEALEPTEGYIDTSYLRASIAKVKQIESCSLDVIIDMHQDLFAQRFSGDGFPDWMVKTDGKSFKLNNDSWSLNYLQPAVLATFDNFWNNKSEQDKYANALRIFVNTFDTLPGVIGYDIMNEPFPGACLPNVFEAGKLSTFYQNMLKIVRPISNKLFFFEPWMSTSAGIPTFLTFKPDGLCVYEPHYYNLICESYKAYNILHKNSMQCALKTKADEARSFKVPMLLGEFGISSRSNRFNNYLIDIANVSDQYGFSWTYWAYDKQKDSGFGLLNDDSTASIQSIALQRIYPQKIAGDNPVWFYGNKRFVMEYDSKGITAPTVIYIPSVDTSVVIVIDGKLLLVQQTGSTFVYSDTVKSHRKIEITYK